MMFGGATLGVPRGHEHLHRHDQGRSPSRSRRSANATPVELISRCGYMLITMTYWALVATLTGWPGHAQAGFLTA